MFVKSHKICTYHALTDWLTEWISKTKMFQAWKHGKNRIPLIKIEGNKNTRWSVVARWKSVSCMGCCHIYKVNNAFANRKIHRQLIPPLADTSDGGDGDDDVGFIKKDNFYDCERRAINSHTQACVNVGDNSIVFIFFFPLAPSLALSLHCRFWYGFTERMHSIHTHSTHTKEIVGHCLMLRRLSKRKRNNIYNHNNEIE